MAACRKQGTYELGNIEDHIFLCKSFNQMSILNRFQSVNCRGAAYLNKSIQTDLKTAGNYW